MKKFLSVLLSLTMLITGLSSVNMLAQAAGNNISQATSIAYDKTTSGKITKSDKTDYYKFIMSKSGDLTIKVNSTEIEKLDVVLYNENMGVINKKCIYYDSNKNMLDYSASYKLLAGTYYLGIVSQDYYYSYGEYKVNVSYKSSNETFTETVNKNNDTFATANAISLNTIYYGQLSENENNDIYKLTLKARQKVQIAYKGYAEETFIKIYNSTGNNVLKDYKISIDDVTNTQSFSTITELNAGTYFVVIQKGASWKQINTNYSFFVRDVVEKPATLKATSNTSAIKLTWSKVNGATAYEIQRKSGNSYIKVATTKNTSYTISKLSAATAYTYRVRAYKTVNNTNIYSSFVALSYCTKPAQVKLNSLTTNTKHQVNSAWSALNCTGYEVQYATANTFASNKLIGTKRITAKSTVKYTKANLKKGQVYYARVRAYKELNGTRYYGAWSNVKSVKCK